MSIFREEALAAQRTAMLGEILLVRPLSFSFLTIMLTGFALAVCVLLFVGSYTQRVTVQGHLVPSAGLIKLYTPQPGVVSERRAQDGQTVSTGDVLYVISTEQQSLLGATQESISTQVRQRNASLLASREKTRELQTAERGRLQERIAGVNQQQSAINAQVEGQHARIRLAEQMTSRYQGLVSRGFISQAQADQKHAEWLDQRNALQSLLRERITLDMELSAQRSLLAELTLKQQNELARFDRELAEAAQALSQSEAKRRSVIIAPQDGTLAAGVAEVGQTVDSRRPLATLLPLGTQLRAELFVPSKAMGFVKPGDAVMIRYQAYPYERFGQQRGVVETVATTALPPDQLGDAVDARGDGNEPLYRISVALPDADTTRAGQPWVLRPGMRLEADLLQNKRALYQWAFDPIQRLAGRL